ncbi:MAG TPA: glycosyltransferase family 39 protein [Phycisphaerae bacterium]|nr:glycosyltransferase family 39 protein [Phycisphaerae bacterium]
MQSPSSTSHAGIRVRKVHPLLLVTLLIQVLSYAPRLSNTFQFNRFNHDDTECYVALGWSIADGRGYTRSLDPNYYVPHKLWPPGLPLMVAACALLSRSLVLPQVLMVLFALANSVLLWALARRHLPPGAAFVVLLMVVCSPVYDRLATVIMTEQPTLFFALLTLWAFQRWSDGGYAPNRFAALMAGGLAYGIIVKGLLLLLVPALWMYVLLERASQTGRGVRLRRVTLLLAVALVPWLAWSVRGMITPAFGHDGLTHIQCILSGGKVDGPRLSPTELTAIVWGNVKWFLPSRIVDSLAGAAWFLREHLGLTVPVWAGLGAILMLVLVGMWAIRHFRQYGLFALALGSVAVLLLIYPGGGSARYWTALHPLMAVLVVSFVYTSWSRLRLDRRWAVIAGRGAIGLIIAAMLAILSLDNVWREPQGGRAWEAFVQICQQARTSTPPDAVICSHNHVAARIISDRPSWPSDNDFADVQANLPAARPVFLVVPSARAVARTGRQIGPVEGTSIADVELIPLGRLNVAGNEFYTLVQLVPPTGEFAAAPPLVAWGDIQSAAADPGLAALNR